MKRKHWNFDRERDKEPAEEPERCLWCQRPRRNNCVKAEVRYSRHGVAIVYAEVDDRHQHEQRSKRRVYEELETRVDATLAAPDTDDQVHGYEHHFPHDVEEEQILSLIHISEPTRQAEISYAVFCLKKKKKK